MPINKQILLTNLASDSIEFFHISANLVIGYFFPTLNNAVPNHIMPNDLASSD